MRKTKHIINGNEVYFIKTDKFKTITIDTIYISPYDNKDFTKLHFLNNFLLRSSKKYNNELKLRNKIIDLYDLNIKILNDYLDYHIMNYRLTFLNEKYTEKGMNEKSINFYYDTIYNPNETNGEFNLEIFKLTKNSLITYFNKRRESSSYLASKGAYESMKNDVPLKYDKGGNKEQLKEITPKNLYEFYTNKMNNSDVKIIVVGDFDDKKMINILKKNIKEKKTIEYKLNPFNVKKQKVTKKQEEKDFSQSIIILAYDVIDITKKEREIILPVLNEILGGKNSKLFKNVREKNSLAYYVYSSIFTYQSLLTIEAGISKENYDKAKKEILKQVENLKNGKLTNEEIKSAIQTILSAFKIKKDRPGAIITMAGDEIIFNELNTNKYIKEIKTVTKKDLITLANKLSLEVDYFLKGVKE